MHAKILILNFCLLIKISVCWWDVGHMLVAQIAELTLLKEGRNNFTYNLDKDAFYLAENITDIMNALSHKKVTNFVESACWADDVKGYGMNSQDNWHFIDLPVRYPPVPQPLVYKPDDANGIIVFNFDNS